ncbi:Meteorin [Camponotus floridanus]|uniref:Meteorin n=2 Tax=Camponotus floridanus TaxID=104421 RepID=E2AEI6_CAMFO|nr:Meteorin [Camponotus floridanus]
MLRAIIVVVSLIFVSVSAYEHIVDQCDWSGSGENESGGVRAVYLRCTRGTVLWSYPRGAMRMVLSFPTSSMQRCPLDLTKLGLRTCVKISGPVQVFLETNHMLRPIYSPSDGKHENSHRCFRWQKRVALFMEAEDDYSFKNNKVKLQYEIESASSKGCVLHVSDEEEECRPCSMEELANAYCQSDLVARGTITAVEEQIYLDTAELVLNVNKILRHVQETENNENTNITASKKNIRVRVPLMCKARHGPGEFIIMAKRRLGDLVLICAPTLETWKETIQEIDNAPCVLTS